MPPARYVLAKLHEVAHQSAYSASSPQAGRRIIMYLI